MEEEINIKKYFKDISEEEYRKSPEVSYSFLKTVDSIGGKAYDPDREPDFSGSFALGSLVDKLITEKDYDPLDDYIVTNVKRDKTSTSDYMKLANYLIDNFKEKIIHGSLTLNEINQISKDIGLWPSYAKDATRIKAFNKDKFWDQINLVKFEESGKELISQDEYELGLLMAETLTSHEYTRDIFIETDDIKIYYQPKIFFRINGVSIKSMLDIVKVDYNNKIIYPFDLKTGTEKDFIKNFFNFKYYLQGGLYTAALHSIIQKNEEFSGWKVAPFKFIYISRKNVNEPLKYEMSDKFIEKSITGYNNVFGTHIKGILELIDDHKWYVENNITSSKRDIIESNGTIEINNPF